MNDADDDRRLPDVLEGNWDLHQVAALFEDLERGAEVNHVQARCAKAEGTSDAVVPLREAKRLLDEGTAKAIQIYYDFDNQSWCDTLIVTPPGVRIIRTLQQSG